MKEDSSTKCWNQVGEDWCKIAQTNDFRMDYIMPFTLEYLGNVSGLKILDLGCGEGGYSRELAKRGAKVTSVDCSTFFVDYAKRTAQEMGLSIEHLVRNSNNLYEVQDKSFDIVLCSMMLMDCEDLLGTMKEINRVLKDTGLVFASVLHPCFNGKHITWKDNGNNEKNVLVENYFFPSEWEKEISGSVDKKVIWRHRTLQDYIKVFCNSGFCVADLNEPLPTKEQCDKSERVAWLSRIPMFLFWTLHKA